MYVQWLTEYTVINRWTLAQACMLWPIGGLSDHISLLSPRTTQHLFGFLTYTQLVFTTGPLHMLFSLPGMLFSFFLTIQVMSQHYLFVRLSLSNWSKQETSCLLNHSWIFSLVLAKGWSYPYFAYSLIVFLVYSVTRRFTYCLLLDPQVPE